MSTFQPRPTPEEQAARHKSESINSRDDYKQSPHLKWPTDFRQ